MPRGRGPIGTDTNQPLARNARTSRAPGPLGLAARHENRKYDGGWLRFDGFQLVWFDSPYPSTRDVGYATRAQSGQNLPVEALGIVRDAVQRPFTDSHLQDVGPIPEGEYDLLINDAGPAKLLPGYRRDFDENGVVVEVWRWMEGIRGMQRIQDDLEFNRDNPRTAEDESSKQVDVWGKYRARIIPRHGTHTFGRGGFYVHSSRKMFGTHGCIETLGDEYIFLRMIQVRERHRIRKLRLRVASASADMFSPEIQALRATTWRSGDVY